MIARGLFQPAILLTFLCRETLIFLFLEQLISNVQSENGDGKMNGSEFLK